MHGHLLLANILGEDNDCVHMQGIALTEHCKINTRPTTLLCEGETQLVYGVYLERYDQQAWPRALNAIWHYQATSWYAKCNTFAQNHNSGLGLPDIFEEKKHLGLIRCRMGTLKKSRPAFPFT
jgi:hypothetical protein